MKTKTSKTTKTGAAKKSAAAKPAPAAQKKVRSMAAYKAHITRQNQILAASKSATVKTSARAAIKAITANMKAA